MNLHLYWETKKIKPNPFPCLQFFAYVKEAEWAIEVMKELGVPVACTMRVGPTGDFDDVPPGECALSMAKAGEIWVLDCLVFPPAFLLTSFPTTSTSYLLSDIFISSYLVGAGIVDWTVSMALVLVYHGCWHCWFCWFELKASPWCLYVVYCGGIVGLNW